MNVYLHSMNSPYTIERILRILQCPVCNGDIHGTNEGKAVQCLDCTRIYPIVDGILRFVDEEYYQLNTTNRSIEEKTKNYFGYEWKRFNRWGFVSEEELGENEKVEWLGGTVEARCQAFKNKCRISETELKESAYILDAGCGNGRYTYEAALHTDAIVIGVDIGYGAVSSAHENTIQLQNVIIIQANLFDLPLKSGVIDACFSNGVLMHTGDARKAFKEISRTIRKRGVFVLNVYHKLNPIFELNDYLIRTYTTRLSIERGIRFARRISAFARTANRLPYVLRIFNIFVRLQPTIIHMYDWYTAPIATHHTYKEGEQWYQENGFSIVETKKSSLYPFIKPWALNIKGIKDGSGKS